MNESVAGPIKFIRNCLASAALPARQFGGMSTPWPDDTDLLVLKTAMHDAYVRTARDRMESRPVDQGQFFAALVQAGIEVRKHQGRLDNRGMRCSRRSTSLENNTKNILAAEWIGATEPLDPRMGGLRGAGWIT